MRDFNTMPDLRADTAYVSNEVIYLKGYHFPDRLGGGGHFVYDSHDTDPDDKGMTIIPDNSLGPAGRWKRVNFEEVNVRFFGAFGSGDPARDDTEAIQNAIDYVANQNLPKGGIVFIPNGTYYVQQIILKDGVSIHGEFSGTRIQPFVSQVNDGLVVIDIGAVRRIFVKDIRFVGIDSKGNNSNLDCFFIESKSDPLISGGGLWEATFENVRIQGFLGHGFYFLGGGMDQSQSIYKWTLPNQFITLKNVRVIRANTPTSRALLMEGQNGQFTFTNCTFSNIKDRETARVGTNVELRGIIDIPEQQNRTGPSVLNFNTCTFEDAELAIHINTCLTINMVGCWFEYLKNSILVVQTSIGVVATRNRFAAASNFGIPTNSNGGAVVEYIMSSNTSSSTFTDNIILGGYASNGDTSGSGGTVRENTTPGEGNINLFVQNNYREFNNLPIIF